MNRNFRRWMYQANDSELRRAAEVEDVSNEELDAIYDELDAREHDRNDPSSGYGEYAR